jgi:mercuric ion transport protein
MNKLAKTSTLGTAILTAVLPLFCCWGPTLLAGVAILSGAATKLAWLHPYEPWLYAVSFSTLGYSHYKAYKTSAAAAENCQSCTTSSNASSMANRYSTIALWVATGLVVILFLVNQFPEWFV